MIKTLSYRDIDIKSLKENINSTIDKVAANVLPIMEDVKTLGDGALRKYSKKFDGVDFKEGGFQVTDREIQDAYNRIDEEFMEAFRRAKKNIWEYHERDKRNSWFDCLSLGGIWGRVIRPLKRIGIYVPGGTAAYPSSVLMNGIPAIIAGVEEIVMVTPPDNKGVVPPHTLAAACELGIKEIYKIGGAQSIAALAYGTESIRPVSKITGPGNIYVTAAKKLVFGQVDIDMLAGPSEIFIIADKGADPRFVAADMLSQAEHDPDSFSVLASPCQDLADNVKREIRKQLGQLPRKDIAEESLIKNALIILTEDIAEAVLASNKFAPEHLEIMVDQPLAILNDIENAGSIFLGPYTPESVGDYFGGTNHILPTGGTAKYASPLSVGDFTKSMGVLHYSKEKLLRNAKYIEKFAVVEGLDAHARAVSIRFEGE